MSAGTVTAPSLRATLPRPRGTLTWLAVAFGAILCALGSRIGADSRWLAALGDAVVRTGAIPHAIPYAAARSSNWHDAPVLGQLLFHAVETRLGDRGLALAQGAAAGLALTAIALDMRAGSARDGARAGALLATIVAAPAAFLVVRGELFSLALFPVLLLLLRSDARSRSRRIWLAVPLLALWANLHGGVLIGFGVLAVYLAVDRVRHRALESLAVLAASALALLATPALLQTAGYYAGVLRGEAAAEHYGLWAPLSLGQPLDLLFLAVLVPLLLATLRERQPAWQLAVVVVLAALTVQAHRNGLWLLLLVAAPAAPGLGRSGAPGSVVHRRIVAACCCGTALLLGADLVRSPHATGAGAPLLRQAAAAARGTPILADALDAEALALRGDRVWIGDPLDAFARAEQRRYLDWVRGRPAGDVLLAAPVRVVLVGRGSEAQRRLAADGRFRELGRDARAVLYTRR